MIIKEMLRAAGLMVLACGAQSAMAQIQFTDVTSGSGVAYTGESYGASWGDVNGDGLEDLFVNHHRSAPGLYINRNNGLFEDRHSEVDTLNRFPFRDEHGATFADFDNDGDQDLMVALGSKDPTQFLINDGTGHLTDHILDYTIDPTPHWQGRMPIWFDFSRDGVLDFAMATSNGIFQLFQQQDGNFVKKNSAAGNQCNDNPYGQLADINYDGIPEVTCAAQASFPYRVYDYTTMPFINRTATFPTTANTIDSVFADFDGDLRDDLFLVTGKLRLSGAETVGPNSAEAAVISDNSAERGFNFKTAGDITIRIFWSARNYSNVRIGASGFNPPQPAAGAPISVTLSPNDPNVVGVFPHTGTTAATSIYISYDPNTTTWTITNASGNAVSGGEGAWSYAYFYVDSSAAMTSVANLNLQAGDNAISPVFFANPAGTGYVNRTAAAGLNTAVKCSSAAAGDFDNDMDMDIYMVCRNAVTNAMDILYQNNGNGTFSAVPNAGGATGPVGAGVGLGENVALADYDNDGFLDIFETNGLGLYPENPYSAGGPDKLYHNAGNANKWIELDLVGTTSNRDGTGAQVTATAGGVTQRKGQNGGYHRWAQNAKRMHFGLATNTTVTLQVLWPSGRLDTFADVPANKIYKVTEAGAITPIVDPTDPGPSICGDPKYNKATDRGIFVYKNCTTGVYTFRASPGGTTFKAIGSVKSTLGFSNVVTFSFETNDTLDTSNPNQLTYGLNVAAAGHDGFDFQYPDGANTCVTVDGPAGVPVYIGSARAVISGPFDLKTLTACTASSLPEISVNDVQVSEGAGTAAFTVSLSKASATNVTVNYGTSDTSAIAPDDYTATSGTLTFLPGDALTQQVMVPIVDDTAQEGTETFKLNLSGAAGGTITDNIGVATITDNEISPCGTPSFNKATDLGVFVYRNCSTSVWSVRVTGGTGSYTYSGSTQSDTPFSSVTPFSIESNDVLDYTTNPQQITHSLIVAAAAQDGFDFNVPVTANVCFGVGTNPGIPVFVGQAKVQVTTPFNLATFGQCN